MAEHDLDVLQQVIDGEKLSQLQIENTFKKAVKANYVCPLFIGSALADIGIEELSDGIKTLLPHNRGNASSNKLDGHVFAINRLADGTRQAYIKLNGGTISLRDEMQWSQIDKNGQVQRLTAKVSRLDVIGANLFKYVENSPLTSWLNWLHSWLNGAFALAQNLGKRNTNLKHKISYRRPLNQSSHQ